MSDQKAGRALDHQIAAFMGDVFDGSRWLSTDGSTFSSADGGPRFYSREIGDAWNIVETLRERYGCVVSVICRTMGRSRYGVSLYGGRIAYDRPTLSHLARADTAPHAICLAALYAAANAVEEEADDGG